MNGRNFDEDLVFDFDDEMNDDYEELWDEDLPPYDEELDFDKDPKTEYLPEEEDQWQDDEE